MKLWCVGIALLILVAPLTPTSGGEQRQAPRATPPAAPVLARGSAGRLKIKGESGKETTLSPAALAHMPRQRATVTDSHGNPAIYEGVALRDVLRSAGVTLGKNLRGPLLANYLVVEAADGYRVVFGLTEIDPDVTDRVILLADRKNGKPLPATERPYRLIVPGDKRPKRWVRQVILLRIGRDGPAPAK